VGTHPVPPVRDGPEGLVSTVHTLWKRCTPSLCRSTSSARYRYLQIQIHLLKQSSPSHGAVLVGSQGLPQELPLASKGLFSTLQKDLPPFAKETKDLQGFRMVILPSYQFSQFDLVSGNLTARCTGLTPALSINKALSYANSASERKTTLQTKDVFSGL